MSEHCRVPEWGWGWARWKRAWSKPCYNKKGQRNLWMLFPWAVSQTSGSFPALYGACNEAQILLSERCQCKICINLSSVFASRNYVFSLREPIRTAQVLGRGTQFVVMFSAVVQIFSFRFSTEDLETVTYAYSHLFLIWTFLNRFLCILELIGLLRKEKRYKACPDVFGHVAKLLKHFWNRQCDRENDHL